MTEHTTRSYTMLAAVALIAAVVALPGVLRAQKAVSDAEVVTEIVTIEAIDHENRLVTLKDSEGLVDVVAAGPEIKRFSELKVGDKVTFRYYESALIAVRAKGQAAPTATGEPTLTRGTGAKPSGTLAKQVTASVVVTAIDAKVPSITVRAGNGAKMSFKVEDKKNIEGVKVGDTIDITYTQALAVSVESPK
jgi:Cu/Ag efflux protein CusF